MTCTHEPECLAQNLAAVSLSSPPGPGSTRRGDRGLPGGGRTRHRTRAVRLIGNSRVADFAVQTEATPSTDVRPGE
jgi:hypothetical protein